MTTPIDGSASEGHTLDLRNWSPPRLSLYRRYPAVRAIVASTLATHILALSFGIVSGHAGQPEPLLSVPWLAVGAAAYAVTVARMAHNRSTKVRAARMARYVSHLDRYEREGALGDSSTAQPGWLSRQGAKGCSGLIRALASPSCSKRRSPITTVINEQGRTFSLAG